MSILAAAIAWNDKGIRVFHDELVAHCNALITSMETRKNAMDIQECLYVFLGSHGDGLVINCICLLIIQMIYVYTPSSAHFF